MKVHYQKLYNMAHLSLNVLLLPKNLNFILFSVTFACFFILTKLCFVFERQVGKDQEKAQSEKDSHSKNTKVRKNQTNNQVLIP